MIVGIGTDIIEIQRIKNAVINTPKIMNKLFTEKEKKYFIEKDNKYETLAGFFAAKEATSKALGTGFRKFAPKDIEIQIDTLGKPNLKLHNEAHNQALQIGGEILHVTISHCREYATAYTIIESRG